MSCNHSSSFECVGVASSSSSGPFFAESETIASSASFVFITSLEVRSIQRRPAKFLLRLHEK